MWLVGDEFKGDEGKEFAGDTRRLLVLLAFVALPLE